MDYESLLGRAKEKSSRSKDESRFQIPDPEIRKEGNKTIVENFSKITDKIRRKQGHVMKFLRRQLGVPGEVEGSRAVFNGAFTEKQVRNKINEYVDEFVLCPACQKADTELVKEERITKIKCEACGTKQAVRKI